MPTSYIDIYTMLFNALAAACFRVYYYYVGVLQLCVLCVYASRLSHERERETHMHARHSSVHSLSLSRSNVRDQERERDARSGLCVCARTHTQALLVMMRER